MSFNSLKSFAELKFLILVKSRLAIFLSIYLAFDVVRKNSSSNPRSPKFSPVFSSRKHSSATSYVNTHPVSATFWIPFDVGGLKEDGGILCLGNVLFSLTKQRIKVTLKHIVELFVSMDKSLTKLGTFKLTY